MCFGRLRTPRPRWHRVGGVAERALPGTATSMITASPEDWLQERSLRAWVCAFLGKPLSLPSFLQAVRNAATVTEQRRARAEMREQVATAVPLPKDDAGTHAAARRRIARLPFSRAALHERRFPGLLFSAGRARYLPDERFGRA